MHERYSWWSDESPEGCATVSSLQGHPPWCFTIRIGAGTWHLWSWPSLMARLLPLPTLILKSYPSNTVFIASCVQRVRGHTWWMLVQSSNAYCIIQTCRGNGTMKNLCSSRVMWTLSGRKWYAILYWRSTNINISTGHGRNKAVLYQVSLGKSRIGGPSWQWARIRRWISVWHRG